MHENEKLIEQKVHESEKLKSHFLHENEKLIEQKVHESEKLLSSDITLKGSKSHHSITYLYI